MAQFPDLNPYRWPGWFLAALAATQATAVVFCFTETHSIECANKGLHIRCSSPLGLKLSAQLKSKQIIRFLSCVFLIASAFVSGHTYAFLLTLVTPVLSDQFGFSVEYTPYFLVGISIAYFASSFIQLIMLILYWTFPSKVTKRLGTKLAKVDNRNLLGLCLLCGLVGSVLVADWQSIGQDPCMSLNATDSTVCDPALSSGMDEICSNGTNNSSLYQHLVESCEALSSSSHQCFWNPMSRITGIFCNTCFRVCLSRENSINFYQFSLGILLLALSAPLGFVFVSAITSEITSVDSQGRYLGLVLWSAIITRAISPYWFVESYELTGRHTYFSMTINACSALVLLLLLAALYRNLAPKAKQRDNALAVNATSELENY